MLESMPGWLPLVGRGLALISGVFIVVVVGVRFYTNHPPTSSGLVALAITVFLFGIGVDKKLVVEMPGFKGELVKLQKENHQLRADLDGLKTAVNLTTSAVWINQVQDLAKDDNKVSEMLKKAGIQLRKHNEVYSAFQRYAVNETDVVNMLATSAEKAQQLNQYMIKGGYNKSLNGPVLWEPSLGDKTRSTAGPSGIKTDKWNSAPGGGSPK